LKHYFFYPAQSFAAISDVEAQVVAVGDADLTNTEESTLFSEGVLYFPGIAALTGELGVSITAWTDGYEGWEYTLINGPKDYRAYTALVIGRAEPCHPISWHQAQLMEPL
jgi:hypothetical protein